MNEKNTFSQKIKFIKLIIVSSSICAFLLVKFLFKIVEYILEVWNKVVEKRGKTQRVKARLRGNRE